MINTFIRGICLALGILFSYSIFAQTQYYTDKDKTHIWGALSQDDLHQKDYVEWYKKNYQIESSLEKEIAQSLEDVDVKIFLGTWCGDSKKWVPRFDRIWEKAGLKEDQLHYIGLHNKDEWYKRGPHGEEKELNIHRVPTFIFYRQGEEIGRIVERPINDLKTDISQIALGVPSRPRYQAVEILNELFKNEPLDSLDAKLMDVARKIYRKCSGQGELNTYGYVLLAQEKEEEARIVFKLNKILHRYNPNVYDSLGEFYLKQDDLVLAKENYRKVLELKAGDENSIEKLNEIIQREKTENSKEVSGY